MTSEKQIGANRVNAQKAGRPPGAMNTVKIALRDRVRKHEAVLVDKLLRLALHAEAETVQLGAINSLLDRGWGKPAQAITGEGGAGAVLFQVITGVPRPEPCEAASALAIAEPEEE